MCDWIPGILELTSKVRYGITSRGLPIFRFVPYDKLIKPLAVGCSQRNLFHNIHAIVSPSKDDTCPQSPNILRKGILIQNLGEPTQNSELQVLLANYAYNCDKKLRPQTKEPFTLVPNLTQRHVLNGFTFNIDPPGCKDVDDSFTVVPYDDTWQITINISDVSALIEEGSDLDIQAMQKATSFYSPDGECLAPMFPPGISESAASLGTDEPRAALSLQFTYIPSSGVKTDFKWIETVVRRTRSFTYDEANTLLHKYTELQIIKDITKGEDSHKWVQNLMILYNQKAGEKLKSLNTGILRSHSIPKAEQLAELVAIDPTFAILAYEAATFCLHTENTRHFGLDADAYAYASSPIRRYCDLVNQRSLKKSALINQELVDSLNRRQKQSKSFSRDLFFMTELAKATDVVEGTVIHLKDSRMKVYVPAWKRCIKVRTEGNSPLQPGTKVNIDWYDDMGKPNWKERIVFRIR
jgi:exoribonuclease R